MIVYFHTFSKTPASTARPTGDGVQFEVTIREACSVTTPRLSLSSVWDPATYNYCWIPQWDRYYWVDEWTYAGGLWWCSLRVDVLASLRDTIRASSQYVTRAAAEWDNEIVDSFSVPRADPVKSISAPSRYVGSYNADGFLASHPAQGYYIVGVINADENQVGGTTYYAFTAAQFRHFTAYLFSDISDWIDTDGLGISQELLKCLFNPMQFITSCFWVPCNVTGTDITAISLGYFAVFDMPCKRLNNYVAGASAFFNLPQHPQKGRGLWLGCAPYTSYRIEFPVIGTIALPGEKLLNTTEVQLALYTDLTNGMCNIQVVDTGTGYLLHQAQMMLGVPISLANTGIRVPEILGGARNIAEGYNSGSISAAFDGVGNILGSISPNVSTLNANGNMAVMGFDPVLQTDFIMVSDDDLADMGRPLCKVRQLSSLPGYVRCGHAHLPAVYYTRSEIGEAEGLLEGGVFIE